MREAKGQQILEYGEATARLAVKDAEERQLQRNAVAKKAAMEKLKRLGTSSASSEEEAAELEKAASASQADSWASFHEAEVKDEEHKEQTKK